MSNEKFALIKPFKTFLDVLSMNGVAGGQFKGVNVFGLRSGYVTIIGWAIVVVVLVACIWRANTKPNAPIVLNEMSLTSAQKNDLYGVIDHIETLPFYKTDLQNVANQVRALSWVDSVEIARDYRRGLVVSVMPKVAVANFGTEHLLDVSGMPFVPADKQELNNKHLIGIYANNHKLAKNIMQKAHNLNQWFVPLGLLVEDLILTERHTWLVRFNNGLRVTVDYNRVDDKLFELSQILKEGNLSIPVNEIAMIDLRYKNGFSLTKKYSASIKSNDLSN